MVAFIRYLIAQRREKTAMLLTIGPMSRSRAWRHWPFLWGHNAYEVGIPSEYGEGERRYAVSYNVLVPKGLSVEEGDHVIGMQVAPDTHVIRAVMSRG